MKPLRMPEIGRNPRNKHIATREDTTTHRTCFGEYRLATLFPSVLHIAREVGNDRVLSVPPNFTRDRNRVWKHTKLLRAYLNVAGYPSGDICSEASTIDHRDHTRGAVTGPVLCPSSNNCRRKRCPRVKPRRLPEIPLFSISIID